MNRLWMVISFCLFMATPVYAQQTEVVPASPPQTENIRYVKDILYVDLRLAPDANAMKIRVLPSGTKLVVLEASEDKQYVRVRQETGEEGWVLSRFLDDQPIARTRLEAAEAAAERLKAENTRLQAELNQLKGERNSLKTDLQKQQQESQATGKELADIKSVSGAAAELSEQNRQLKEQLVQAREQHQVVQTQAEGSGMRLALVGILAIVTGLVLGIYVGYSPMRRERQWRRMPG